MKTRTRADTESVIQGTTLETGVDELNLAEFPLAAISDRFWSGQKTVVFEDTVFCHEQRQHVPRKLTISGSDRYGLPTAKDDDILLACIQISKLGDFASPEVRFSRYEILKLLRWPDDTWNYQRVADSLRRWKGLTVYSDRAFYDHEQKSWVNRDFGIFDTLTIYRKEVQQGKHAPGSSRFVWNEVMYRSFQAGYLKRLDWGLYTRLESPVAKRLYRFLDKRFYHGNRVEIDLQELAVQKVRLSSRYTISQWKRELLKGISELEECWDLRRTDDSKRFVKEGKGCWNVIFERKPHRPKAISVAEIPVTSSAVLPASDPDSLVAALIKREIGPGAADDLVSNFPETSIRTMIELFDWYNSRGQERGAGFLVQAIRNPGTITLPKGFESSDSQAARQRAEKARIAAERELRTKRERDAAARENSRQEAFLAFWGSLSSAEQDDYEREALDTAEPTKRTGYLRAMGKGTNPVFEQYRMIILRDHFERTRTAKTAAP